MSVPIIKVESVGKRYTIGEDLRGRGSRTFRDVLEHKVKSAFHRDHHRKESQSVIWALKDISFEVEEGEVLGIIGRNGAGKSTLLKILSRITEPTEGKVTLRGRVASLLDVGTGFSMELTGRENIYLNGAILGMRKTEIDRKFDEIVEFANVEKFLDTPVKRYSSGMYVRLAFAVAAHLDPDILIVDEVLAVGDVEFQKKCTGRMRDVSKGGRTILFVSHNMSAIQSLCRRAMVLHLGRNCFQGDTESAIGFYLQSSMSASTGTAVGDRRDRTGSGRVRVVSFRVLDLAFNEVSSMRSGGSYLFEIGYDKTSPGKISSIALSVEIFDERGSMVLLLKNTFTNHQIALSSATGFIFCKVQRLPFTNGRYSFAVYISQADNEIFDLIYDVKTIDVAGGDFFGTGSMGAPNHCKMLMHAEWHTSGN